MSDYYYNRFPGDAGDGLQFQIECAVNEDKQVVLCVCDRSGKSTETMEHELFGELPKFAGETNVKARDGSKGWVDTWIKNTADEDMSSYEPILLVIEAKYQNTNDSSGIPLSTVIKHDVRIMSGTQFDIYYESLREIEWHYDRPSLFKLIIGSFELKGVDEDENPRFEVLQELETAQRITWQQYCIVTSPLDGERDYE